MWGMTAFGTYELLGVCGFSVWSDPYLVILYTNKCVQKGYSIWARGHGEFYCGMDLIEPVLKFLKL